MAETRKAKFARWRRERVARQQELRGVDPPPRGKDLPVIDYRDPVGEERIHRRDIPGHDRALIGMPLSISGSDCRDPGKADDIIGRLREAADEYRVKWLRALESDATRDFGGTAVPYCVAIELDNYGASLASRYDLSATEYH